MQAPNAACGRNQRSPAFSEKPLANRHSACIPRRILYLAVCTNLKLPRLALSRAVWRLNVVRLCLSRTPRT